MAVRLRFISCLGWELSGSGNCSSSVLKSLLLSVMLHSEHLLNEWVSTVSKALSTGYASDQMCDIALDLSFPPVK